MATQITRRVHTTVLRREDGGEYAPHVSLAAERFMGTLFHPVPRSQMLRKFGMDRRGCKITARWCRDDGEEHPVRRGDVVEIEGSRLEVLAVEEHPGCYLELYVDER